MLRQPMHESVNHTHAAREGLDKRSPGGAEALPIRQGANLSRGCPSSLIDLWLID
jgi:hypothetical protein